MVCDENLSKFLANKNLNTLYMDFLGQKILILNSYSSKTKKANFSVFGF
ncbi:magnesium transporter CorA family protein, partial [Campylobacter coli]|nr:magnesium transporter CorA family protein [Campylobacter coli]